MAKEKKYQIKEQGKKLFQCQSFYHQLFLSFLEKQILQWEYKPKNYKEYNKQSV